MISPPIQHSLLNCIPIRYFSVLLSRIEESGLWSDDMRERQLSHSKRNKLRAAYIHTSEHLDERRLMVQWWADYLN
ncbi:hypothetical protein CIG61_00435 [Klebsiella variicola]|nr:hypothetical protein CIG61_00435 [Klebsiella variicola]